MGPLTWMSYFVDALGLPRRQDLAWRRADSLSPKHPDNLPFLLKFYLTSLHVLFVYLDYKYVKNSIMYLHPHSTYQRVIHILINSGEKKSHMDDSCLQILIW